MTSNSKRNDPGSSFLNPSKIGRMEGEIFFIGAMVSSLRMGNPKGFGSPLPPPLPLPQTLPPPILGYSPFTLCTSPSPSPTIVDSSELI